MTPEKKVVLITGALSDIGRAVAHAFAGAGYAVALNHHRADDEVSAFVKELRTHGNALQAIAVQADISSRTQVQSLFEQTYDAFGRIDVLVNNAGVNRDKPFEEMTDEDWDIVVSTILKGTFMCSQEFAIRYGGTAGNIINIGAITGIKGRKNGANYCSARAGVVVLTKCMALELAPRIRVNTITPGRIDTRELQDRYHLGEAHIRQRYEQEIPLAKMGEPKDVASMALFLVETGTYITGQNFLVDGGLYMR
jgi:NAD(P)-dependent dehydrogenase (short-subunit alcohol dehydrogenase family)